MGYFMGIVDFWWLWGSIHWVLTEIRGIFLCFVWYFCLVLHTFFGFVSVFCWFSAFYKHCVPFVGLCVVLYGKWRPFNGFCGYFGVV